MSALSESNSTLSTRSYLDKEWLRKQYSIKSIQDIAAECGVSNSTIRKYLKKFNIKTRSISEAMKKKYQDSDEYLDKKRKQWNSEEYKNRHKEIAEDNKNLKSKISKQLWQDKSFREKHKNQHATAMQSVKYRKKMSGSIKEKWQDEEYRSKQEALSTQKSEIFSEIMKEKWRNKEYRTERALLNVKQGELRRLDTDSFIERAVVVSGDSFSYDDVDYVTFDRHKVIIQCTVCNYKFNRLPGNHLKGSGCPRCLVSAGQREIYELVAKHGDSTLNERSIIRPYEIDIFNAASNVGVEYHGLRWHSYDRQETSDQKQHLQKKATLAVTKGIRLLQFFDFQWDTKREIVKSMILNALGKSVKINARSLELKQFDNCREFFDTNHLYGYRPAKYTLGLCDNDEILIAISLSHSSSGGLEIIRLASKLGHIVRGGISKLLNGVKRYFNPFVIETFADLCYSNGVAYKQVGFTVVKTTKPGYFYYKRKEILSRQRCQKHKLTNLLGDGFDPDLSESLNMFTNGYRRVWNAGHLKMILPL